MFVCMLGVEFEPQQEQVLLTAEPSLQPLCSSFKKQNQISIPKNVLGALPHFDHNQYYKQLNIYDVAYQIPRREAKRDNWL